MIYSILPAAMQPSPQLDDTGHFRRDAFSALMVGLVTLLVTAELGWVLYLALTG